jgi:uncharacterized protein YbjT (DUF2867 family)
MILVAGGTGKLGAHIVPRLAEGAVVRVLTRDAKRAHALSADVELVTGDLSRTSDVAAAVKGCQVVISAVHGFAGPGNPSPEAIDRDATCALIRAAKDAGVAHFVLVSVQGAARHHPMSLHRAKFVAEEALRESGLAFTILRPTAFMETWIEIIGAPLADKGHALVFGPGRNPINFVSVRDVAALTILAVKDQVLRGEVVEIGGENLDFVTMAERLIEARGKPARIKHIPLSVLRMMSVLARPFSPVFARQAHAAVVMNTTAMTVDNAFGGRHPSLPRTTLKEVLDPASGDARQ